MSSILDSLRSNERWFQQKRDAVPWPFRLKEEDSKPSADPKMAAIEELQRDLARGVYELLEPDKWELIPDAVEEEIAAELIASRRFYEDSAKQLKKLRKQWSDALLKRDDLAEFAQKGRELRELESQRAHALDRIRELTAVANERSKEPEFQRLAQLRLQAEVRLSGHDRIEVLLAQQAWDKGSPFVSLRLTGDSSDETPRSRVWTLALAQVSEIGWHMHTWSASEKVATPLFHRPS